MTSAKRPYLVVPLLVEQPTWGGSYIATYKGWQDLPTLKDKNIGQSYELAGKSLLSTQSIDSESSEFLPSGKFIAQDGKPTDIGLPDFIKVHKENAVGPFVFSTWGTMPILIKFTQAKGNSFQLHAKPDMANARWKPKAESWYFLEKGIMTCGIQEGCNIPNYKACCLAIEAKMKELSAKVQGTLLPLDVAKKEAKEFILAQNPWQYVNVREVEKYCLVDLSGGGLHHSWEDRPDITPEGNIIYEVQQDVEDDDCTLRSFDQGKFKDDGSIRPITIEDYFAFLDPDPSRNAVENAILKPSKDRLLKTKNYSMDVLSLTAPYEEKMVDSFVHLFVLDGKASVQAEDGKVTVSKGHSAFVPYGVGSYTIVPQSPSVSLIKTFIEK